jgi:hypothetical protein
MINEISSQNTLLSVSLLLGDSPNESSFYQPPSADNDNGHCLKSEMESALNTNGARSLPRASCTTGLDTLRRASLGRQTYTASISPTHSARTAEPNTYGYSFQKETQSNQVTFNSSIPSKDNQSVSEHDAYQKPRRASLGTAFHSHTVNVSPAPAAMVSNPSPKWNIKRFIKQISFNLGNGRIVHDLKLSGQRRKSSVF